MSATQSAAAAIKASSPQSEFGFPDSPAASLAKASVDARHLMAMRRPRNLEQACQKIIQECKRPRVANDKRTWYFHPITGEGLGIGFVELAIRCLTNILVETELIADDDARETRLVRVTDLEANVTYPIEFPVTKTVERFQPALDGSFASVRTNAAGRPVYALPASDDDMLNRRAVLTSKAIRSLGLKLVPSDIQAEARETIRAAREVEINKDIDGARKQILDALERLGINAESLELYLGHGADACTAAEIVELRCTADFLRDGEISWQSIMDRRAPQWFDAPTTDGKAKAADKSERKGSAERIKSAIVGVVAHKHADAEPSPATAAPTGPALDVAPSIEAINQMAADAVHEAQDPEPAMQQAEPVSQAVEQIASAELANITPRTTRVRPTRQTTAQLNLA